MANAPLPLDVFVKRFLAMLGSLLRERAHAQLTITVREGKIVLVEERRTRAPENLPEV